MEVFVVVLLITYILATSAVENNETFVESYVQYLNNRTEAALQYVFPSDARMYEAADKIPQDYGTFDFIIIGAGSTGCVIANRLSEISDWSVLLLEAGTFRDKDLTGIPSYSVADTFTKFNWGYEIVPQHTAFFGTNGRNNFVARGKGIGGSSLINGLVYSRGNKLDFDRWSSILNDPNWNYENVLPYFKKSENFTRTDPLSPIDVDYHGYNGPLHMTQTVPWQENSAIILKGVQQFGYNITDYNGKEQLGGSILQLFTKNGYRFDPDMAFIEPIRSRKNFKVLDYSYVTKIKINPKSKRAEGVVFTRNNKTYIAKSRLEVVLSAGAIASPQILMLSGVGPRQHLQSLNIPVIENLPVGQNLHDHTYSFAVFSSNITIPTQPLEKSVEDLVEKGQGPLTRGGLFDTVLWFKTPVEKTANYPDMEFLFSNISGSELAKKYFDFTDETFSFINPDVQNPLAIQFAYIHQKSVGSIKLKSADPFEYPLIDPNFLNDENGEDIETLYQSVQLVLKLLETEAFRSLNISLVRNVLPSCNHTEPFSRQYWYCYFRTITVLGLHQVGSCATGTSPKTGVVDNKLQVFGVTGLRVADASVIPVPITGHTNAACTMVGEKISDIIKQFYGYIF